MPSFKTLLITLYYDQLWNLVRSLPNIWVIHLYFWMTCVPNSLPSSLQVTCANSSWFKYAYSWSSQHPNFSQAWVLSLNNLLFFTLHTQFTTNLTIINTCISFMISISCIPFSDLCQLEFMITSCNTHPQQPSTPLNLQILLHFHYPLYYWCPLILS